MPGLLAGGLHAQNEWQSLATRGLPHLAGALGALVAHPHVSLLPGERRRSRQCGDRGLLAHAVALIKPPVCLQLQMRIVLCETV